MPKPDILIKIGSVETSEYEKILLNFKLQALKLYAEKFKKEEERRKNINESFDCRGYIDWLVLDLTNGR